jgi:hypothetical protein
MLFLVGLSTMDQAVTQASADQFAWFLKLFLPALHTRFQVRRMGAFYGI